MSVSLPNTDSPSLLLVDDDELFLGVLSKAMSRRGYLVWPAISAMEALAAIDAQPPDFAVLDLHLKDGSGLDILEALRRHAPEARSVILSGYVDLASAVTAVKLGARDCMAKPVDADELDKALMSAHTGTPHMPDAFMHPDEARMQHILSRWVKNDLNTTKAADELGLHRRSLQRMLRRAGLSNGTRRVPKSSKLLAKYPGLADFWRRAVDTRPR